MRLAWPACRGAARAGAVARGLVTCALSTLLLLLLLSASTTADAFAPGRYPSSHPVSGSAAFMSPSRLLLRGGYGLLRRTALTAAAPLVAASSFQGVTAMHASSGVGSGGGECAAKPPCARVIPVPILSDNYAYIVVDPKTGQAACVDPAEPEKILAAAKREGVSISTLLCTHKHWDHAGGNEAMAAAVPGLAVVTTKHEEIPAATVRMGDGDVHALGALNVRALYTPCHTRGHVLFLVTARDPAERAATAPVLFSGDTLFVGGCGRFFEGDGQQMYEALMGQVAKLPPETLVYCGHEYTKSNLAFAKFVEPDNQALLDKIAWTERTLASGGYTVPSTVGEELATNPFMRVGVPAVVAAAKAKGGIASGDPAQVMGALRELKNNFKG